MDILKPEMRVMVISGAMHIQGHRATVLEIVHAASVRIMVDSHNKHTAHQERCVDPSHIRPLTEKELEFDDEQISVGPCSGCVNPATQKLRVWLTKVISFEILACESCASLLESRHGKRSVVTVEKI